MYGPRVFLIIISILFISFIYYTLYNNIIKTKIPDLINVTNIDGTYLKPSDFVIILTSTVYPHNNVSYVYQNNHNERIQTYEKSFKQWIDKSNIDIVIVENSGYDFSYLLNGNHRNTNIEFVSVPKSYIEPRMSIFSRFNTIKGQMETLSLEYALNNSKIVNTKKFVIKITGRYYVPELESHLSTIPTNIEIIRQHNPIRCELFGASTENAKSIFRFPIPKLMAMEYYLYLICQKTNHIVYLPQLDVPETQQGGRNRKIKYL